MKHDDLQSLNQPNPVDVVTCPLTASSGGSITPPGSYDLKTSVGHGPLTTPPPPDTFPGGDNFRGEVTMDPENFPK